ncbi:MAG: T9SS type A sorting domain-containing protein [Muribaculaceae bacterium]|nr:T9SS type A sorting domain-containing protein [Muribaculaceae bacterium]
MLLSVHGQSMRLAYDYDAAGNRIARHVVTEQQLLSPRQSLPFTHGQGEVTVRPSVTTDEVTISTTIDLTLGALPWELTDIQGRVLASGEMDSPTTPVIINGSSGVYLITVMTGEGPVSFRVIKQ